MVGCMHQLTGITLKWTNIEENKKERLISYCVEKCADVTVHVVDHELYYNKYMSSSSLLAFCRTKKFGNFTKFSNMIRAFIKQFFGLRVSTFFKE